MSVYKIPKHKALTPKQISSLKDDIVEIKRIRGQIQTMEGPWGTMDVVWKLEDVMKALAEVERHFLLMLEDNKELKEAPITM